MVIEFKLPDLGEGLTEAEVRKWMVDEGDEIEKDQVVVEVETDKAVTEMPSPAAGTIEKIHHKEGDIVKVGETLITISDVEDEEKISEREESVTVVGELPEYEEPEEEEIKAEESLEDEEEKEVEEKKKVLATPAVRRMAKERDIDLQKVEGTGPEGRITEEDLEKEKEEKPEEPKKTPKFDHYGYVDREPLRGVRRTVAKNMMESLANVAQVTAMEIIDVTELYEMRNKWKEILQEKQDLNITYLPFIIKAVVQALKDNPILNSSLDMENEEIVIKKYYNIGFAVSTEDGLMVPVLKGADQKKLTEIAEELVELSELAISRKIDLADLKGGTFTITNYGVFGGTYGTPIINYPEVAILGTGRIVDTPLVIDGEIKARKAMHLSLTFDHQVLDGADAARFMNDLKKYLENPNLLLISLN
jgi:pyruvate dehydrogenase E2 component (dihydrolipoamide acetyltransferase)